MVNRLIRASLEVSACPSGEDSVCTSLLKESIVEVGTLHVLWKP